MNPNTGELYASTEEALRAGEALTELVEITGTPKQVRRVANAVQRDADRRRRKQARKSRKRNRS